MSILDVLADAARERVEQNRKSCSLEELKAKALSLPKKDFAFEKALKKPGLSYICECKKASPSKGLIDPEFDYLSIAKDYEAAGADALSVLTEPTRFLGKDEYLEQIAQEVSIPILRKDFTIDPYMIYEARILDADAILLIVSLLSDEQLIDYMDIADKLGLSALVECHDEQEIERALKAGARIIGVNNRNLKDFSVDVNNAGKLRNKIPEGVLFVSESGVKDRRDTKIAEDMKADAVLIGEALMRAEDKKNKLDELKGLA